MKQHELYRQWVALTDSSGKADGVQGYAKLSITVLAPGDIAPAHNEGKTTSYSIHMTLLRRRGG